MLGDRRLVTSLDRYSRNSVSNIIILSRCIAGTEVNESSNLVLSVQATAKACRLKITYLTGNRGQMAYKSGQEFKFAP